MKTGKKQRKKKKKVKEKKSNKKKKKRNQKEENKEKEKPSVPKPVTPATGYQASAPTCIDGWDGMGWVMVVVDGQAKSKKNTYFKNISKTIRYFFLVVSCLLRRVLKTFSV